MYHKTNMLLAEPQPQSQNTNQKTPQVQVQTGQLPASWDLCCQLCPWNRTVKWNNKKYFKIKKRRATVQNEEEEDKTPDEQRKMQSALH
jgi:hypothetical protein